MPPPELKCWGSNQRRYRNTSKPVLVETTSCSQGLSGQLNECPVIAASCFLPINAVIVFVTFRVNNCSLPHILHKVFEKLVLSCIVHHITDRDKFKGRFTASCLGDLPPGIEVPLSALSFLAFMVYGSTRLCSVREISKSSIFKLISALL